MLYNVLVYRDHFVHSLQIFLFGCYIVDIANYNEQYLESISSDRDRFLRIWFLISFFHDIGYLTQKLIDISAEIKKMYFRTSGVSITNLNIVIQKDLEKIFKSNLKNYSKGIVLGDNYFLGRLAQSNEGSTQKDLQRSVFNELINAYIERNHGIISALFLHYAFLLDIKFITQENYEKYLQELNIACSAICTHDIEKNQKIHLDFINNFFASLIILSDNVQEWDRPYNIENEMIQNNWRKFSVDFKPSPKVYILKFEIAQNIFEDVDKYIETLKRIFKFSIISGPNLCFIFDSGINQKKFFFKIGSERIYDFN